MFWAGDGMSDLHESFMNEFIRLEKLCKDLYRDLPKDQLKGVKNYIDDMKNTPMHISRKIPNWDFHLRELERLKKIRNNRSHVEYGIKNNPVTQEDIEYLRRFRKSILNQTDPISQAYKINKKSNPPKKRPSIEINRNYDWQEIYPTKKKAPFRSFIEILLWIVFTLGVTGILLFLLNGTFPIFDYIN